jgi:lipopolysaccharide transport system permease protein
MSGKVIYSADAVPGRGFSIWLDMFRDVVNYRDLMWELMRRNISVRYRQSLFGYIWAVVPQIVTTLIFVFLAQKRVFAMGQPPMPYIIFVLWNISVWQLFSSCLLNSTMSLVSAGTLVTKNNFPKEALIFASIGQPIFDFIIRLFPFIICVFWLHYDLHWGIVFIPALLVVVVLLALGTGFVLSIANLVVRDISNALSVVLMFGIFLAPILYPPPLRTPYHLVNVLNPFSPLLIATQDILVSGQISNLVTTLCYCLGAVVVFFLGWLIFHISLIKVIEKA